jgi:hypothetical protein
MLPGGHALLHKQHRIHRRLSHPRHVLTVWEPRPVQTDPPRYLVLAHQANNNIRVLGPHGRHHACQTPGGITAAPQVSHAQERA